MPVTPEPAEEPELSPEDRRRTLAGLRGEARRIAESMLDTFTGWDTSTLLTLRAYAFSCVRLEKLQASRRNPDVRLLHRELRQTVALLKALNLEPVHAEKKTTAAG